MSLLSDEEISDLWVTELDDRKTVTTFARAIEAAILAKLASAKLPEPSVIIDMDLCENHIYDIGDVRKAYVQGAASQLAEKPSGYLSQYNLEMLQQGYPQTIVMLEGAKRDVPLYTRREA